MKKRILTALLAALLLSSCGNTATETTPGEGETAADAVETVAAETETEKLLPDLPDVDYEGYEYSILSRGRYNQYWQCRDVYAEELTGEPINDAVFNRNALVESTYNVVIREVLGADSWPTPEVQQVVRAGEDVYDLVLISAACLGELAPDGMLLDLNQVPYLDLSKPWYDQYAQKALSLGGKLFMTTGDLTVMDNDATWSVLFNKDLAEQLGIEGLYDLVLDGGWTMDAMRSYGLLATADLDGNGVHDEHDQWGIQGEGFNTMAYIHAAGASPYGKDENDLPIITVQDEHFYNAFMKAITLNGDFELCMYAGNYHDKYGDEWTHVMYPSFAEGRVLFSCGALLSVTLFREMEADFGILPLPKYDEAQEEYHSLLSLGNAGMFGIPVTAGEPERNGVLLEALSAESLYTLTPAYYDVSLKTKSARDEESSAMLDLILAARAFDLGNIYADLAVLFDIPGQLTAKGSTDLISSIETQLKTAQSGIDKLVEAVGKIK